MCLAQGRMHESNRFLANSKSRFQSAHGKYAEAHKSELTEYRNYVYHLKSNNKKAESICLQETDAFLILKINFQMNTENVIAALQRTLPHILRRGSHWQRPRQDH